MTAGGSDRPDILVDTGVAVADHDAHGRTVAALGRRRCGLCGHAAFETFSVLTRLPPPTRRTPAAVTRLLDQNFPHSRFLDAPAAARLLSRLSEHEIAGGSVYDALVGATAAQHDVPLATRDRRALEIYRRLDVQVELIS